MTMAVITQSIAPINLHSSLVNILLLGGAQNPSTKPSFHKTFLLQNPLYCRTEIKLRISEPHQLNVH